jgi:hypothetical protein
MLSAKFVRAALLGTAVPVRQVDVIALYGPSMPSHRHP